MAIDTAPENKNARRLVQLRAQISTMGFLCHNSPRPSSVFFRMKRKIYQTENAAGVNVAAPCLGRWRAPPIVAR